MLAAAAILFAGSQLLGRPRDSGHVSDTTPAGAPVVLGSSQTRQPHLTAARGEADSEPALGSVSPAATRTARRFVTAYLRWEQGQADPPTRSALRATASLALWQTLHANRGEPTASPDVTPAQLRELVAGATGDRRAATIVANLRRHHRISGLAIVLRHSHAGWRVTSLRR